MINFKKNFDLKKTVRKMMVPLLFILIISIAIPLSGFSSSHLINQIMTRVARDSFLVVALIIPVLAGMGINFALSLGAMAAQIGIILVQNWSLSGKIGGVPSLFVAMLIALPLAILFGWFAGTVMNRAKGREMITSMILDFLFLGLYQFLVLYVMGSVIPINNTEILLGRGYGIRNTIRLQEMGAFDKLLSIKIKLPGVMRPLELPIFTYILIALACIFVVWFRNTKLGHDMNAVGQDQRVANSAGLKVDKIRVQSIIISTVMAMMGQIIYLQNIGTMNVYNGTQQTSLFSAAALLVGGASVSSASIPNAFLGVVLFHTMFIVMPNAGKAITGNPAIGEYFRSFISYGVVALALIMHAWSRSKQREEERKQMRRRHDSEADEIVHVKAKS